MAFGRYDYAAFASFFAYAAGSVVVPVVLVTLARELHFNLESGGMTAGGALHLGRTALMMVSMLLCGFAGGRWGKRRTVGWSVALMAAGVGLCAVSPVYGVLFLAMMLAGLGEGVIEGLATPFVQCLHPTESGRYINFTHSFWSVGVLVTTLVSGWLLTGGVSWRVLVAAASAVGFFAALLLLWPERKDARYPEHPKPLDTRAIWDQMRAVLSTRRFWLFYAAMFVAGGGEFALTFWCASYIQLNVVDAAWAGGVGTACFAGGMVLGRTGWGYLIDQHHLRRLIILSAAAGAVITAALPFVTHLGWLFVLLFLSGVAVAPYWPSVQSYCTDRLPQLDSTMLLILLSCAGIPGCGVTTWLVGLIGNHYGLKTALYLVPISLIILAALIVYDWKRPSVTQSTPRTQTG